MQIANTAKILVRKMSPAKRCEEAELFTRKIATALEGKNIDILKDFSFSKTAIKSKGSILNSDDITNLVKKYAPNANIELAQISGKGYNGFVDQKIGADKKTIIGLIMELPFFKRGKELILPKEHFDTFIHEARHIFDYLLNPKFALRNASFAPDLANAASVKRFEEYERFYKNSLYKKSFNFSDTKRDFKEVGEELKDIFKNEKTPIGEQINALQAFRYGLMTEKNAYASEAAFSKSKTNPLEAFCFDEKIKVLNKLLGEKLELARFEHAVNIEAKNLKKTS